MADIKDVPQKFETAHYEAGNGYPEKTDASTVVDSEALGGQHIENVLSHYSKEQLLADVDRFATEHDLGYAIDDLRKGALLAQRPHQYMSIPELDEADRAIITQERLHKWKHPMTLYWTIFVCSVGAATQGWDQTGSNGANLSFPKEFGIDGTGGDEWLVGLINAAPYFASALLGCWLSDPLNNILGRRGVIFLTALCLIATPIASGFTKSWQGLFVCRLESPRWLLKKNRHAQAYKSLLRLRFTPLQAARDLYYISAQLDEEKKILRADSFVRRLTELFVIPRVKRATWAAFTVMLAQHTIFAENGFTPRQALYASLGFGAVNFVFAWPAIFTIDTYGRRSLLLFTFPIMAVFLLAAGLCFLIPVETHKTAKVGLAALFIYLFAAAYSPGEGPVPFTYSAEVFPLAQREIGMAFAVSVCLGFSAILSITFPSMLRAMGATGAFCFYAGLNVVAFIMIFHLVPETKALTLEELDSVFNVPTAQFVKYQYRVALPYWIKRWIFWKRNVKLEPLFILDEDVEVIERKGNGDNSHN
ncbi:hypothetical protein QFC22_006675 [Naganishia vaughanmartiniae]|uniref:Uncharacterized protein n=1 Tax=Naganishia vaughanmartiniae TaxID=1424756 RepID=A0ACC2WH80_9TREE|nr:hypothetical protein QFC22_006675 [Naganishia vaughanmartiniae]